MVYPLGMSNIAIENGPVEIVDLAIKMVIFQFANCKRLPEGNLIICFTLGEAELLIL